MVNRLLRDEVLNAITVIRGRAEVLRATDDERSVQAIERRSEDVESTIQNVKHITRNGAGTTALDATSVEACVTAATEDVQSRYPDAHVAVEPSDADGVTVWANSLLEDAVFHLVENAVAYSEAATPVSTVAVTADDDAVTISVSDNGPGLPDRQQELIRRGEIADYENRSTGFGLNIVRLLARSYDGAVAATVTDGGTTVRLTLRRADGETEHGTTHPLSSQKLGVATGASLVAGAVMGGVFQTLSGSVPVIGALYGVGNLWVGWITHLFHSLVFGLVYAALVALVPTTYSDTVRYYGAAFGWALTLWLVAASIVMPLWLRLVGVSIAVPALQVPSLIAHLLWGVTLATVYRYLCSLTR